MHVNQVGSRVEVVAPDGFEEHGSCDGLPGMTHHEFEHAKFGGQQFDVLPIASDLARDQVEFKRSHA